MEAIERQRLQLNVNITTSMCKLFDTHIYPKILQILQNIKRRERNHGRKPMYMKHHT